VRHRARDGSDGAFMGDGRTEALTRASGSLAMQQPRAASTREAGLRRARRRHVRVANLQARLVVGRVPTGAISAESRRSPVVITEKPGSVVCLLDMC